MPLGHRNPQNNDLATRGAVGFNDPSFGLNAPGPDGGCGPPPVDWFRTTISATMRTVTSGALSAEMPVATLDPPPIGITYAINLAAVLVPDPGGTELFALVGPDVDLKHTYYNDPNPAMWTTIAAGLATITPLVGQRESFHIVWSGPSSAANCFANLQVLRLPG